MFGNHLLGLYEKALDPVCTWKESLEKTKVLGFDYMEISIDENDERIDRLYWPADKVEALRRTSYETGVALMSMCLSAHRRFPFGSADPDKRNKAFEIMSKAIDFASALGIRVIQLAGYDVYYEESTPESVRMFKEGMKWAAGRAAAKQVMLAMETMDTPFINSITKHLGYEKMINSPWYRVYPDLGNLSAWGENDPQEELAGGIGSIVGIHLKDTVPPTGGRAGKFKCVPFGDGCVDFRARFAQLERLGYTGPYMIEMWYAEGSDDVSSVKATVEWLENQYCAGTNEGCDRKER